jgi:hypothetical protein
VSIDTKRSDTGRTSPANFAGRDGDGASHYTDSKLTLSKAKYILAHAHFAPDPSGVQKTVYSSYPELNPKNRKLSVMAKKRVSKKKVETVMSEYKSGELNIGKSKKKVKKRSQAIAIAMSEAGVSKKKKTSRKKK